MGARQSSNGATGRSGERLAARPPLRLTGLVPKATLLLGTLFLAFAITQTSLSILAQKRTIEEQLQRRADATVTMLAEVGALRSRHDGDQDLRELRSLVEQLSGQDDMLYVAVHDGDGSLILGSAGDRDAHEIVDDSLMRDVRRHGVPTLRSDATGLHVAAPIHFGPERIGVARLGLSHLGMTRELEAMRDRNALLSFWFLIAGLGLTFLFVTRVTRPLVQVIEGTEAVSLGRFDGRIRIRTYDELEVLAGSFNRMLDKLEATTVSRDYLTNILQSMSEALAVLSADGRITLANHALCRLLDYTEQELKGMPFERLVGGGQDQGDGRADLIAELRCHGSLDHVETEFRDRAGQAIAVQVSGAVMQDGQAGLRGMICLAQDNRERQRQQEQIKRLAYFDSITGLPNRVHFQGVLEHALATTTRHGGKVAVLFLDLDRFKRINDTLGHATGDRLLKRFGDRLVQCVRAEDTVGRPDPHAAASTVARLGGDEFTLLLGRIRDADDAARVARRLLVGLDAPFDLGGHEVVVEASIGIAIFPDDSADADTLLMHADMAMYHAKSLGRANFQFYHRGLNARALERLTLENDLRRALEQDQLSLYFQPQLDLRTGRVVGAEALLRWHHPERGLIPPDDFIALAEESGLILSIGQWVLRAGCSEACAWRRSGLGDLRVAINISSLQWQRPDFVAETVAVLRETGLPPALLELEVTESTAMAYAEATATTLQRLRALGMAVAIDDFGTGYSSLNYLKSFPRPAEDRPLVHQGHRGSGRQRRDRHRDHRDGSSAPDRGGCRGGRDRGAAGVPARARLRSDPGPSAGQAAARRAIPRLAGHLAGICAGICVRVGAGSRAGVGRRARVGVIRLARRPPALA